MRLPFSGRHAEVVRDATRIDLGALSDDLVAATSELELSPQEEAASYLDQAVEAFEQAEHSFDQADEPDDFADVTAAIGRSRHLLACARARANHKPAPDEAQPCFFDPSHGPAARLIVWTPPDGQDPRTVPVCGADGELLEADIQPEPRRVAVGDEVVPYWDAPSYFVPWFSGYFESVRGCAASDLLAGLPLGEAFQGDSSADDDLVFTRQEIRDRWDEPPPPDEWSQ